MAQSITPRGIQMTLRRLLFSAIVALAGYVLTPSPLLAGKLCDGTMKIIVQFGPAASISIATRALAVSLEKRLDQQIVVENKAGANGQIAAQYVHNANPDFRVNNTVKKPPIFLGTFFWRYGESFLFRHITNLLI